MDVVGLKHTTAVHSILIFKFIWMFICMTNIHVCIVFLKPLYMYALLVRDMKDRWNCHIKMLFSSLPRLKIYYVRNFDEKNLFLLTNRCDYFFVSIYQNSNASLKVTVINIFITRGDFYTCVHLPWLCAYRKFPKQIFPMQSNDELYTERKCKQ